MVLKCLGKDPGFLGQPYIGIAIAQVQVLKECPLIFLVQCFLPCYWLNLHRLDYIIAYSMLPPNSSNFRSCHSFQVTTKSTVKGKLKKQKKQAGSAQLSSMKNLGRWKPQDDLLLMDAVQQVCDIHYSLSPKSISFWLQKMPFVIEWSLFLSIIGAISNTWYIDGKYCYITCRLYLLSPATPISISHYLFGLLC